ncbi:uncharacterized protein N7498_007622 [Penicillium cinerascens]|uniref:Uncharacterized protein n=1 Tax=Penicillium cinerascens TaxID=70096 RepID=A0A9W9MDJ3_9EURO|nr:uncharacterized protein N7498_007622 [Penicillium cinerascens]KAJ5198505.1 hypothetical protein N7498_007622 [Penicillium cinerascens]
MEEDDSQIALQALSRRTTEPEYASSTEEDRTREPSALDVPPDADSAHLPHDELPAYSRAAPRIQALGRGHSATLHHSPWVLFGTILFAALVVYSWVVLAILSFRPMSTRSWEAYTTQYGIYPQNLDYSIDAQLYRSARIIQSIVSVLILPWTSAVCAYAAVVFVQNQKDGLSMTMRQVMNLADRRWMDISLIPDLIAGSWKQHGSALLALAIFLHFLGLIIYPIQSIVINSNAIHVPVYPNEMGQISDLAHMREQYDVTAGSDVVQARNALAGVDMHTWHPQLWEYGGHQRFSTFVNLSAMNDPFFSPLPNGFNTGLLRQYAPRINSNTSVRVIQENEYPSNCHSDPTNFFANYSSVYAYLPGSRYSTTSTWVISACMLSSNTTSPWSATRDRQDFYEVLYINASNQDREYPSSPLNNGTLLEVKLHTTAGYFELPSYMNNQTAGPLLDKDPTGNCDKGGYSCIQQAATYYLDYARQVRRQSDSSDNSNNSTMTTNQTLPWSPMLTSNKGPLLTTALAIFGPGSFLNTFFPEYYTIQQNIMGADINQSLSLSTMCIEIAPLTNMFSSAMYSEISADSCVSTILTASGGYYYSTNPHYLVGQWLDSTFSNTGTLTNALNAAAFLANKQFVESLDSSYGIYQDLGSEMMVPQSSVAGVAVVSAFLGLYILILLALSLYGCRHYRWTSRLDSFAMLRFGAAYGNGVFPMLVTSKTQHVKELDEVSGVVREVGSVADDAIIPIGRIGLGEGKPLRMNRRYECYQGDNEPLTTEEALTIRRGG